MTSTPFIALAAALLGASGGTPPEAVVEALHAAAPRLADRVAILSYRAEIPSACNVDGAEVIGGLAGSGQTILRLQGTQGGLACEGWATVQLRLFGHLWVTRQPIAAGAPIAEAVGRVEREIVPGLKPVELSGSEIASQSLAAGRLLEAGLVRRPGPTPGARVSVVLQWGGLKIQQVGSLVSCPGDLSCARLSSGKQVQGVLSGSQLLVESP
jgi:hypothetical protein